MSGQLYTTHLLSLEALLTVIDSTESHCQNAKVLSNAAQEIQDTESQLTDNPNRESAEGNGTRVNSEPDSLGLVFLGLTVFGRFFLTFFFLLSRCSLTNMVLGLVK